MGKIRMQNSITFDEVDINSNSLDFVGIIAALDVMVAHTSVYIIGNGSGANIPFWRVIAPGPAVVAFFTISGFLTFASYEHSKNVLKYYVKRIARIYPALLCAIVLPIVIYSLSGSINIELDEFVIFLFKKVITGRGGGYNPSGAIGNGSLWTIFIQIQFYILTPIIYLFLKNTKRIWHLFSVLVLVILNIITPVMCTVLPNPLQSLYKNDCIPYLYMYMLGAVLYMNRKSLLPLLANKAVAIGLFVFFAFWQYILGADFWCDWTYINPISGIVVGLLCISLGFCFGRHRIPIDFSYGLFLWHLPVMDILHTAFKMDYSFAMLFLTWAISIIVAIGSSVFIEQPIVRIVRKTLK